MTTNFQKSTCAFGYRRGRRIVLASTLRTQEENRIGKSDKNYGSSGGNVACLRTTVPFDESAVVDAQWRRVGQSWTSLCPSSVHGWRGSLPSLR